MNLILKARLSAKISFHSYANKANFHNKNFALSLAFIMRFTATRKWLIEFIEYVLMMNYYDQFAM